MTMQRIRRVLVPVALVMGLAAALATAVADNAAADHTTDDEARIEAFDDSVWRFVDAGSFGGTPEWTFAVVDGGSLDPIERHGYGGSATQVQ